MDPGQSCILMNSLIHSVNKYGGIYFEKWTYQSSIKYIYIFIEDINNQKMIFDYITAFYALSILQYIKFR